MTTVRSEGESVLVRHADRLVVAIFVLSGAAGLMYEVVWARQLVLVFGNTTQAVATILTAFFGGMAIGSVVGGRVADRVGSSLRLYGLLELIVAIIAIVTPLTFALIGGAYGGIYPSLVDQPGLLGLVRFALALVALAPATVLMGATLPALTRHLRDHSGGLSGAFGRLYAANLVGAIAGTALAGMILIEMVGLTGSLVVAAGCSALAGVVAVMLSWRASSPRPRAEPAMTVRAIPTVRPPAAPRSALALALAFASGLTALGYQVLWFRLVGSGTGGSTYVFTAILILFLGGLAIGARTLSAGRLRRFEALAVIAVGQALVAALATLGLLVLSLVTWLPWTLLAIVVVLPTSIVLGITLPASAALLPDRPGRAATESGGLLAANTAGSIVGTFVLPFMLVPVVGSPVATALLALVNGMLAVGVGIAWARERSAPAQRPGAARWLVVGAGALSVLVVVGALFGSVVRDPAQARILAAGGRVDEATEDEIASVHAGSLAGEARLWVGGSSMTVLTVDARLMAVLPAVARPDASSMLVVAFGMGSTFRSGLIADFEVDAVELVPSVPGMFPWYYPDAARFAADPRGRIVIADGRNHVELVNRRYDVVVVDPPPPPESSGVSVISSLEFYVAAAERLTPGGLMLQWVPFNQRVDDIRTHVRTFAHTFPYVVVLLGPSGHGIHMLGSAEPISLEGDAIAAMLRRPGVLEDLSSAIDSPARTLADWVTVIEEMTWLEDAQVGMFAGDGLLVTDDHPVPEYFALRRALGPSSPPADPTVLRALTP